MQNVLGHREMFQGSFNLRPELHVKNIPGPPSGALVAGAVLRSLYKNLVKNIKTRLLSVDDSGAHFSVSNAEFEGGGDGHGHGGHTFLAK
jgi:hypothetical protein